MWYEVVKEKYVEQRMSAVASSALAHEVLDNSVDFDHRLLFGGTSRRSRDLKLTIGIRCLSAESHVDRDLCPSRCLP